MKGRLACLLLLLSLALPACSKLRRAEASPTPAFPSTATANPTATSLPERRRVIVISWDGAPAEAVYPLMEQGLLPNAARLAASGVRAEYARSVDPTLTAAVQNSILSGSYPARTGVVSNSFHNPTDSFYWYRRGFDEPLDQAEPVWVTASRAGLKTASTFFTGGSPGFPGQMADYTIGYGVQDAYSRKLRVLLQPVDAGWQGDLPVSYSPPYEGSYIIRDVTPVYLYVVDSLDDGQAAYDAVWLSTERRLGPDALKLAVGEWGRLLLQSNIQAGAEYLLQAIGAGQNPSLVTLFQSGVYHNTAAPRELLDALNARFGFFPSGADAYALEHRWITPEDNLHLLERQARWMAEVAAWVFNTYQPDLLFTWQDGFDTAGHSYLMSDPRQAFYSPTNLARMQADYRRAIQSADQSLGVLLDAVDLDRTTVLLVSDHGMAPAYRGVYVNTLLQQAGLLTLDRRNYVVLDKTLAFAVASGGAANIYINLQGHEKDGWVRADEYPQIQAQIVALFDSVVDPESGDKVFSRVVPRQDLGALHLDHLNSGDVFLQARPGYHLDGWRGKPEVFTSLVFYGQHGYDSALPEMRAIFIAAGPGVPAGGVIPPVTIVDYAPTVATLLGFAPADSVEGTPIPALVGGGR